MVLAQRSPRARPVPRRRPPARRRCLVVSADGALRRRIDRAASAGGWECVAPPDAAGVAAAGVAFGIVFIDLVRPPAGVAPEADGLIGAFAADRDLRVVACGAADRPDEEVRARAQGVSVYLPGAADGPGFAAFVRDLCR